MIYVFMFIQHFWNIMSEIASAKQKLLQKNVLLPCVLWNFIARVVMKGRAVAHFFVKVINSNYVHQLNELRNQNVPIVSVCRILIMIHY